MINLDKKYYTKLPELPGSSLKIKFMVCKTSSRGYDFVGIELSKDNLHIGDKVDWQGIICTVSVCFDSYVIIQGTVMSGKISVTYNELSLIYEMFDDGNPLNIQVGGSHYKNFTIQPVEFIFKNNLNFLQGNVVKYVCRYKEAKGKEDLEKAKHYIDLLIQMEYGEK